MEGDLMASDVRSFHDLRIQAQDSWLTWANLLNI